MSTRSSGKVKFVSEFISIARVKNSFLFRVIALWNKLPKDIAYNELINPQFDFKRAIKDT